MKSIPFGSTLNPFSSSSSSLRPSMVSTAVLLPPPHHARVSASGVQVFKFRRLMNHLPYSKLKYPESPNKYYTDSYGGHQRRSTKVVANAASEFSHDLHGSDVNRPQVQGKSLGATFHVISRFSKLYTLQGVVLGIISISFLAVQKLADLTPSFFIGVLQVIIAGSLANLYVAGINQLSDIDIDKINKPHYPLASGELSVKTAIRLVSLYAVLGFCLALSVKSWPLKLGILLWYAFGTAYSVHLPLLRWKRDPVLAAICVWAVQGVIVPILFYLHTQKNIYGRPFLVSKHAIFVSGIMSIFAVVAALFKDIPDVEGDKINGINSLASQIGIKPVFWFCIFLLEMAYGVAILIGLSSTRFWIRLIMVVSHGILGFILWRKANLVDIKSNEAIESLYLFIWKLNGVEFLLVPFLRF